MKACVELTVGRLRGNVAVAARRVEAAAVKVPGGVAVAEVGSAHPSLKRLAVAGEPAAKGVYRAVSTPVCHYLVAETH